MKKTLLLLTLPALAVAAFLSLENATSADEAQLRILKFEADWCGPCQQMKPVFDKVSRSLEADADFVTINVDQQPDLAQQFAVRGLPTVIAIKDGKEVDRSLGFMDQSKLNRFIKKNL